MSFYKNKIEDKKEIGWNKELVLAQECDEQHDLIVDRIDAGFDLVKDHHVDGLMLSYGFAN